jgi:hypothetical protein
MFLFPCNLVAQDDPYHFSVVDTTQQYKSVSFARTLNYYWDQGFIGPDGTIYFTFVDAYNLYCYVSEDDGATWTREQIVTGFEGDVYSAMMGMTIDGRRVIVYSVNTGFNDGTVTYGSEFLYDAYAAVEGESGWTIKLLRLHSGNSGLLPYGVITTKSGIVHVILHKYGWNNIGGELYEAEFDPQENTWGDLQTIKIFSDRNIDRGTNYVGKTAELEENEIVLMYQRHGSVDPNYNVEILVKGQDGWGDPQVILENNSYSTYNRFDIEYDRHGHTYIGYFEPWGANGPEIYMAHNSTSEFTKYELFESTDTLRKMSIHAYADAVAYVYCNFKNSMPKILKYSESGLEVTDFLPEYAQEDSADVMRFHYDIPYKNNYEGSPGLYAFTNRYNGKDGDFILPYEIVYVSTDLMKTEDDDPTDVAPPHAAGPNGLALWPNPAGNILHIDAGRECAPETIRIFTILGAIQAEVSVSSRSTADVSGLSPGVYFIRDNQGRTARFVKR